MKYLLLSLVFFGSLSVASAQLSGIATYKSDMNVNVTSNMDSQMSESQKNEMQAALRKAMQKEYELKFIGNESTWKEKESLGSAPQVQSGGMSIVIKSNDGVLYKNVAEQKQLEENDLFGKPFLIDDTLEPFAWELQDEYKQIGEYTCQKATFQKEQKRIEMTMEDGEHSQKEVIDTVQYTAWYTPQIPVKHGPDDYWGLPGLIMEITNGRTTLICSKVVLNPSEKFELVKPEKGRRISQEEYRKLQDEKMKEMSEQYQGKDGKQVMIKIGG